MKAKSPSALDALSPPQRRVATFGTDGKAPAITAGPLALIAGAGTGKTSTLAHRAAHLILNGVDPARILILTLNLRSARELIRRIQNLVSQGLNESARLDDRTVQSRLAWTGSFYSVAERILRRFANQLGLDPGFTLISQSDAANLMGVIHHDLGFTSREKRFPRKDACLWIYTHRVNARLPLKQTLEELFPQVGELEADLTRLFREYVARKQKNNLLDFDDLLLYWQVMMQTPAVAQVLAGNFDHVLVDDYQELSTLQCEIIQTLKPDGQGVAVVGDDSQAIHPLRTKKADNIPAFVSRFVPKAETVLMAQNYRSAPGILDCANSLLAEGARQHRKTLFGISQSRQKPLYVSVDDEATQLEYIVSKLVSVREHGGALKRHAILYRNSRDVAALVLELGRRNIPFVRYGGRSFAEGEHIKDMLAVLRWVDNPRNGIAGLRVLKLVPEFGSDYASAALAHFEAQGRSFKGLLSFDAARQSPKPWKAFCALLEKLADPATPWSGQIGLLRQWYKPQLERLYYNSFARIRELEYLEQLSAQYSVRERFLSEITLDPPTLTSEQSSDTADGEDYVILSKIQATTGQEWDIVYVMNVCNGNFPTESVPGKPDLIEEERRLLYVAMTRARLELHLCAPQKYTAISRSRNGTPQVFTGTSRLMTDKVLESCERVTYRSIHRMDSLSADDTASVDIASFLKDMW